MAASRYKHFLDICNRWPKNEVRVKYGLDFGTLLEKKVKEAFTHGDSTKIVDPEKCYQIYQSLLRMSNDHYKLKYPRKTDTSFTGVSKDVISTAIDEVVKQRINK